MSSRRRRMAFSPPMRTTTPWVPKGSWSSDICFMAVGLVSTGVVSVVILDSFSVGGCIDGHVTLIVCATRGESDKGRPATSKRREPSAATLSTVTVSPRASPCCLRKSLMTGSADNSIIRPCWPAVRVVNRQSSWVDRCSSGAALAKKAAKRSAKSAEVTCSKRQAMSSASAAARPSFSTKKISQRCRQRNTRRANRSPSGVRVTPL